MWYLWRHNWEKSGKIFIISRDRWWNWYHLRSVKSACIAHWEFKSLLSHKGRFESFHLHHYTIRIKL